MNRNRQFATKLLRAIADIAVALALIFYAFLLLSRCEEAAAEGRSGGVVFLEIALVLAAAVLFAWVGARLARRRAIGEGRAALLGLLLGVVGVGIVALFPRSEDRQG